MAETSRRIVAALRPEILEQVDEVAKVATGDAGRIVDAAHEGEFAQSAKVPQVGVHRVAAVAGLEREKVAEPLQPEGPIDALPNRGRAHACCCERRRWRSSDDLRRADAEQLRGEKHEPVLVRAECARVAERHGPHALHQLQPLGLPEADAGGDRRIRRTGCGAPPRARARAAIPPAESPQRSRRWLATRSRSAGVSAGSA